MKRSFFIPFVIALLCLPPSPALAQRDELRRSSPKVLAAFGDVVAKPGKSLVRIQCNDKDAALGTVVAADGWVLTKASLLPPGSKILCKLPGDRKLEAKVIGVEEPHDLALLKVAANNLTPIEWKTSKEATPGDWVATPGDGKEPAGIGVVSVAARSVSPRSYPRILTAGGGFLGITGDPEADTEGVKIRAVQPNSAADKAGLKVDDLIVAINGKKVRDIESLQEILGKYKPEETVTVRIKRDKEEKELKATLGKRPPELSRGDFQNNLGSRLSDKRTGFPNILQHDTVLNPPDCGGPLVDLDGKAVGINIARAGRVESYAIPSDTVLALLPDLKSGKLAPKPAVADPTKPAVNEDKIARLEAALQQAERKVAKVQEKSVTVKALVKQAEEAKKLSDNDPDAADVYRRAAKYAESVEKQLAEARQSVEKARAELKTARDGQKKEPKAKK
ncbi:MAG: PDZ domain-containing protein [Planctomycetes bacterium]|nr:PDZ domain-containing protein [Planctomycetota bacterium]